MEAQSLHSQAVRGGHCFRNAPGPRLVPQFLLLHLFFLSLSDHKNTIFTVLPPLFKSPQRPHHNNKSLNEQMNGFPDTQ